MIFSRIIAFVSVIAAGILVLMAIPIFAFVPFAEEIDDVLGPILGGSAILISSVALALDAREVLNIGLIPKSSNFIFHSINFISFMFIGFLVVPTLLTSSLVRYETFALCILLFIVAASYFNALNARRTIKSSN